MTLDCAVDGSSTTPAKCGRLHPPIRKRRSADRSRRTAKEKTVKTENSTIVNPKRTVNPMKRLTTGVMLAVVACATVAAKGPDPRLARVRNAFVVAVDELGDDQAVASCFADHLHAQTPIKVVTSKDEADVVFRVSSHLPSTTTKVLVGMMGGSPSAHLYAELPDGTKLWDDGAKYRRSMEKQGNWGSSSGDTSKSIECGLADELANTLRDAMREARDANR